MPVQNLRRCSPLRAPAPVWRVRAARLTAFGGALALTLAGEWQMSMAVSAGVASQRKYLLLGLFLVTFGWIAFSAASALAGLLFSPVRPVSPAPGPLVARTVIIMPVHAENSAQCPGALAAVVLRRWWKFEVGAISG